MNIESVKELKEHLVGKVYGELRKKQDIEQTLYEDTFTPPQIDTNLQHIQHTGRGRRMVDRPAEHITTSNPQVFVTHKLKTKEASANKIAEMFNQIWVPYLRWQNPNPFKESTKKVLYRGETYGKILHNEDWVTGKRLKRGLPVHFLIPDSRNIYVVVDKFGQIQKVIVWHKRQAWMVKDIYGPNWTTDKEDSVDWLECWDEGERYFEADGKQVLHSKNIYGFIPFFRALSGFGTESAEGKLEDLVVGRLRFEKDTLNRQCAMTTDLDSIFHQFANMNVTVQPIDDAHSIPDDFQQIYSRKKGRVNEFPFGITVERDVETLPDPAAYEYYYSINAELDRSDPLVMGGFPAGSSGRQDDLAMVNAMRRYETVVENIENLHSQMFAGALKIIYKVPTLRSAVGLSKDDIDDNYQILVKLKASDPLANDRKATLGSRLLANNEIDPETNLIEYKGYTQDKALKILVNTLKWRVLLGSPDIAELIGLRAAEKSGMGEDIQFIKARRQQLEKQQAGLMETPPATAKERQLGEVKTPMGRETMDAFMGGQGARSSPERYTRGS